DSQLESLTELVGDTRRYSPAERLTLVSEFLPRMEGSDKERMKLAESTLSAAKPAYDKRGPAECNEYLDTAERLTQLIPSFGFLQYSEHELCECLDEGFSGERRKNVILKMSTTAKRVCKEVRA